MTQVQQPKTTEQPRSLTELFQDAPPPADAGGWDLTVWIKLTVLAGLCVALTYWQWGIIIGMWQHNPNWSFGPVIPLFSLYLLYARRHEFRHAKRRTCWGALPLVILAILVQALAMYPIKNNFTAHCGMILMLLGLVLLVAGPRIFVLAWLPVAFLLFCMPFSDNIYGLMANPMQNLAAKGATVLLHLFGADISNPGGVALVVTSVTGHPYNLTVAEACSGMRSLMAFAAIGVAMAYLENRPVWQRVVLVLAAVPIAIFCNVLRVMFTCTAYVFDKPEFGKDFMHEIMGVVMLIPAFFFLWLLSLVLKAFYVEVDEEDEEEEKDDASGQKPQVQEVQA